jgi:hypothetical protein
MNNKTTGKSALDRLRIEKMAKEKENAQLKLQILTYEAQNKRKKSLTQRRGGKNDEAAQSWKTRLHKQTKIHVWRPCKFINSEKTLMKATLAVCRGMNLHDMSQLEEDALREAEAVWCADNNNIIRTGLNETRNYAQAQVRELMVNRMILDLWVPSIDDVVDCATREDLDSSDDRKKIFEFYWDNLLFRIAGKPLWDQNIRHHGIISTHTPENSPTKPYIMAGTEAFICVLFQNCYDKWVYMAEERKKGNTKPDRKHPRMKCPYTDSDAGQKRWGGWNDVGRKRFREYEEKVREARRKKHVLGVEKACLARLRVRHKIEEREAKRGNKGTKRPLEDDDEDDGCDEWD